MEWKDSQDFISDGKNMEIRTNLYILNSSYSEPTLAPIHLRGMYLFEKVKRDLCKGIAQNPRKKA